MEQSTKEIRKQISKVGGFFFIGTLVIFAVQMISQIVVALLKPEWMQDVNVLLLLSLLPMYLLGMPFLIWLLKRIPGDAPEKHDIGVGKFLIAAIMCYAIMYLSNVAGTIVTFLIGILKGGVVQNELLNVTGSTNLVLNFVVMVLCAPLYEEYIFRKLLIDRTARFGQGVAVLLSGLMFGLFHGNLNQFVYAFTMGCFLAFIYVKTGNLKITVLLHMIVNFMGVLSLFLLQFINYDEFASASLSGDSQQVLQVMLRNMPGLMLFAVYGILLFCVVITGFVLLIVYRKRFKLSAGDGEPVIPKGQRFKTVILNLGIVAYSLLWLGMIVWQLLR